ncbi:MAG: RimK family alpha-L-glutamate ligase [Candidatus Kapaibacterium sp.]
MTRLAILTCERMRGLLDYDRANMLALRESGVDAEAVVWDDPAADFTKYDALLFRTTWDYYQKYDKFTEFLDKIESMGIPTLNPLHIIRGNMHKYYLRKMADEGVPLIPTEFIAAGSPADPDEIIARRGWERFIIKPAVSASSYKTAIYSADEIESARAHLAGLTARRDALVQRFMPEIRTDGELSTFFYSDGYTYSVRKRPKAGDFRVQVDHGGVYTRETPDPAILRTAREIAERFLPEALYIRVDGVISGAEFRLMEVEMLEPDLYHNIVPEAKQPWRDNLLRKLEEIT